MSPRVSLATIIIFFTFCFYQGLFHQPNLVYSYENCEFDGNVYRPGGKCKETTPYVNAFIEDYPATCSPPPAAEVEGSYCGEDDIPNREPCPQGGGDCMRVLTQMDLTKAQIGGLGPDDVTLSSTTPDLMASFYPFMGLADKPIVPVNVPRESYRTFWRMSSIQTQFSAKARLLQKFIYGQGIFINPYYPPINNYELPYYPTADLAQSDQDEADEDAGNQGGGSDPFGINIGYMHLQKSFCALSKGRTATVMVNFNETSFDGLVDCYKDAAEVIVRVAGIQPIISSSDLGASGAQMAILCSRLPNCKIEFGNEVNNRDTEYHCKGDSKECGAQFAAQYAAFRAGAKSAGGMPVGAAALDVYNTVFPYKEFLAGALPAYTDSDIIFTNIYCLNDDHVSGPCPAVDSGLKEVASYSGGKPIFITEYGFNPKTKKGLKYWVDWLYANPPPHPATILTPNLCPLAGNGEWLHVADHAVYDLNYSIVNQTSCAAAGDVITLPTFTLLELWNSLPDSLKNYPVSETAYKDYQLMEPNTRAKYDALTPFVLDNARGYLAMNYVNPERGLLGTTTETLMIAKENLAYVYATNDVLNEPAFGIVPSLLPGWIDDNRKDQLSTDDIVLPEETWGGLDFFRYRAFTENMRTTLKTLLWERDGHEGIDGCRGFTKGPTLESPLTYPTPWVNMEKPEFEQPFFVPVQVIPDGTCQSNDANGAPVTKTKYKVNIDSTRFKRMIPDIVQDTFGRSVGVFNNPKQRDISMAISEPGENGANNSLYHALIPGFFLEQKTHEDIPMLADEIPHKAEGSTTTDGEGVKIARVDGEAEIDLCTLRNFWFRSASQQRGGGSVCNQPENVISSASTTENRFEPLASPSGEVKQHLYEPSCGGQVCYEYILSRVTSAPRCQGKYLNPYVAIAISLNENGGLVSDKPDATSLKHFGCDVYGRAGVAHTIEAKLACMVNTFAGDCAKPESEALSEYGYLSGRNLNTLVSLLGGDFPCNGQYCFSLWVDGSQAQSYAKALESTLPSQTSLWQRYYSGYINSFK